MINLFNPKCPRVGKRHPCCGIVKKLEKEKVKVKDRLCKSGVDSDYRLEGSGETRSFEENLQGELR